jgi:hypothetical protein
LSLFVFLLFPLFCIHADSGSWLLSWTAIDHISGLGFRPISVEHEGSSLIWYNASSENNHKNWTMNLEKFLEGR